jgi:hypothetical protein
MRSSLRLLAVLAATSSLLALAAAPAGAQTIGDVLGTTILNDTLTQINLPQVPVPDPEADGTTPQSGTQQQQQTTTTTTTTPRALGYYCKGESKRHVRGATGTPFSRCVTAMGKLRKGTSTSAAAACKPLSRKHFTGMKRTPYAVCVSGGNKLLADQKK